MFNLNKKVTAMMREAQNGEIAQHESFGKNKPNRLVTLGFDEGFWVQLACDGGIPAQEIKGEYKTIHSAIVGHLL